MSPTLIVVDESLFAMIKGSFVVLSMAIDSLASSARALWSGFDPGAAVGALGSRMIFTPAISMENLFLYFYFFY